MFGHVAQGLSEILGSSDPELFCCYTSISICILSGLRAVSTVLGAINTEMMREIASIVKVQVMDTGVEFMLCPCESKVAIQ